ncbi:MAG TPA: hypothetical protein VNJ52_00360 [Patescibacteria group bacterium]|nr:hypothetical protein [Patescibacteria group bacterium]
MTIAACFKYDGGMVFCADTKITTSMKTLQTKIYRCLYGGEGSPCATVFVLAGSVPFARAAIADCEREIGKLDLGNVSLEALRKTTEEALVDFYRRHNPDGVDESFRLLMGVWLRGETGMFSTYKSALTPVDEWDCVGSGSYIAKYWIRKFFDSESKSQRRSLPTLTDVALISGYALQTAMDYDESCGGQAEYVLMTAGGEVGSDVCPNIYPCDELPDRFQAAMWRMLRKLSHSIDTESVETVLDEFGAETRKIAQARIDWLNALLEALKRSIERDERLHPKTASS